MKLAAPFMFSSSFFQFAQAGFVVLLVAVVPTLSYRTSKRLEVLSLPRLSLYVSAAFSQWLLALGGAFLATLTRMQLSAVGLRWISTDQFLIWTAAVAGVSLAALGLVVALENRGWFPPEPALVRALIPETRQEKLWALLIIAPTAGLCEEFLYRGILLALLVQWMPSVVWAVAVSSTAFGLAHVYQGASGIVRAALLGALLCVPVARLGSILPSMAAHFFIDAVALVWLGPKMQKRAG